jgi:hypothetical protein
MGVFNKVRIPSESTPMMKYFIYNKTVEHEGNLMLYEFKMGSSNNPSYHSLAFILCTLEHTVRYHEAMPNDNKTLEKLNYNTSTLNPLGGNTVTNKEDYLIYGIIAVVIVFIVVVLIRLVMKYICKRNNTSKKNKTQNRRMNVDTGETSEMENNHKIKLLREVISKDSTKKDLIHATLENGEMNDSHGKKLSEKCLSPRDSDTNDTENESSKCLL